jgi:hypothetical protein
MEAKVEFSSIGRFLISLGVLMCVSGFGLYLYGLNLLCQVVSIAAIGEGLVLWEFMVISTLLLTVGGIAFLIGLVRFWGDVSNEESFRLETKITNILDQDLKFIELKTKTLEYNEKVVDHNRKYTNKVEHVLHRNFATIAQQAMNPNYYRDTYHPTKVKIKKETAEEAKEEKMG